MPRLVAVLAVPALLLSSAPAAPLPKGGPGPGPYYPTTAGAKWVMRHTRTPRGGPPAVADRSAGVAGVAVKDGVTTVTTGREATTDTKDGPKTVTAAGPTVVVSADGVFDAGSRTQPYVPPLPLLKGRPEAGVTWTWSGRFGRAGVEKSQTRTAVGGEEVEVPAGKVGAVRVDVAETVPDPGRPGMSATVTTTEWYARGVGLVKRANAKNKDEGQLVSFTPGKGEAPAAEK